MMLDEDLDVRIQWSLIRLIEEDKIESQVNITPNIPFNSNDGVYSNVTSYNRTKYYSQISKINAIPQYINDSINRIMFINRNNKRKSQQSIFLSNNKNNIGKYSTILKNELSMSKGTNISETKETVIENNNAKWTGKRK